MDQSIGAVLALAVGVALSPLPIIAVILMLCSTHARVNGTMFLLGWVSGLTIVTTAACLLGSAADVAVGDDTAETGTIWWWIGLGVLLLALAARKWRASRKPGFVEKMPTWMQSIEDLSAGKAWVLGVLLTRSSVGHAVDVGADPGPSRARDDPGDLGERADDGGRPGARSGEVCRRLDLGPHRAGGEGERLDRIR